MVESKDDSVAEEEVYKVTPEAKGGMIMEPASGMNALAVHLHAQDNLTGGCCCNSILKLVLIHSKKMILLDSCLV